MTLRGYEAGVRRSAAAGHPVLRDLTANAVNDYIRDAIRRKRRFLAHHNGRALRVFSAWLVEANLLREDPLASVKVPNRNPTRAASSSRIAGPRFLNRQGDALTYHGLSSIFRRLRAHLPAEVDFKSHCARNTAITNWLRSGTDLYTTMHLAGHKNPKVTERVRRQAHRRGARAHGTPRVLDDLRQEGGVVTRMKTPGLDGKHPAILKARKPEIVREIRRGG